KLQAAGELADALSRVEEGLSSYPRDARLLQLQDTVHRDLQTQRRQTRRRDLEELRRLETEADSANDAIKQTIEERARVLADKYAEDQEFVASANGLLQRLSLPGVSVKSSASPSSDSPTMTAGSSPTMTEMHIKEDLAPTPPVAAAPLPQAPPP